MEQKILFLSKLKRDDFDQKLYNDLIYDKWEIEKLNERTFAEENRNEKIRNIGANNDEFLMKTFQQNLENKMDEQVLS
jgi:hypothetical protein